MEANWKMELFPSESVPSYLNPIAYQIFPAVKYMEGLTKNFRNKTNLTTLNANINEWHNKHTAVSKRDISNSS